MFVHIGDRKSISDKHLIAILNCETLSQSPDINSFYISKINKKEAKTIAICTNSIITTRVSSYTIIKRYGKFSDAVWSKRV